MRRGQTTLEYVLLIGIAAAGIIAVIVYVSRGHQGNLRSQAEQLSTEQYAPGKTTVDNSQSKNLASIYTSTSSTTVKYGNMNEPIRGWVSLCPTCSQVELSYEDVSGYIRGQWVVIYELRDEYEKLLVPEGSDGAAYVRQNGLPWTSSLLDQKLIELNTAHTVMNNLVDAANAMYEAWSERTKDQSSSGSYSSETGTEKIHKQIDETLGDW